MHLSMRSQRRDGDSSVRGGAGARLACQGLVAVVALAALWGGLQVRSAHAAEWSASPSVHTQFFYDDNFQLHTVNKNSETGFLLEPRVVLARSTETTNLQLDGGVQFRRYPGASALNSNDRDLSVTGSYLGERSKWALDAGLVRDTTATSTTTDAGLVQNTYGRHQSYVSPSWTWMASQRSRLGLSMTDRLVNYHAPDTQFSSYRYLQANGTWTWQYSALTQLQVGVTGSRFKVPANGIRSNSWGLQVGATHQFSERLSGSLSVGRQVSLTSADRNNVLTGYDPVCFAFFGPIKACAIYSNIHQHTRTAGLTVAGALTWKDELDTYQLSVDRATTPSGLGQLTESDTVRASVRRHLREHLIATLSLYGLRSRALSGAQVATTYANRTYVAVTPGLEWDLTRYWRLHATYAVRRLQVQNQTSAVSNRVVLSIQYTWPKFAMSR